MSFWDWLFRRRQREEELDEEVQAHLRMAAQERMERGETAEQARAQAFPARLSPLPRFARLPASPSHGVRRGRMDGAKNAAHAPSLVRDPFWIQIDPPRILG